MKIINIKSSSLPDLGIPTKEMIARGFWFLYSCNDINFLLVTDEKNYILNNSGLIISERPDKCINDLDMEDIIEFSDVPTSATIGPFEFN
jgi:hypothetical protein